MSWQALSRSFRVDDFMIASFDGKPVGCCALIDYDLAFWPDIPKGGSLYIHKLAVRRSAAGKGVSEALLHYAKIEAMERGISEVRLDTHQFRPKLRALYDREGFQCVAEKCLHGRYHTAFYLWQADQDCIHTGGASAADSDET